MGVVGVPGVPSDKHPGEDIYPPPKVLLLLVVGTCWGGAGAGALSPPLKGGCEAAPPSWLPWAGRTAIMCSVLAILPQEGS